MRERKPETIIAELRRELKRSKTSIVALSEESSRYLSRANRFEREAAEWKRRFDELLLRLPVAGGPEKGGGE